MRPFLLALLLLSPLVGAAPSTVDEIAAAVGGYRAAREQLIVDDFMALLAIPNVASDSVNIERNARHIEALLQARGVETELLRVDGAPPVVFGELPAPGATRTILVYVHYDGQPVAPANWASDPWVPVIRTDLVEAGGEQVEAQAPFDPEWRVFARSAGDDKAPITAITHALDALQALDIPRTVNLKFFFEGEEEAGSPHLERILRAHAERLEADLWLFCDGPMHQTRRPQLAYGVRGVTGFELTVYGPARPLHSGHYGNWAPNPIAMLTRLLSSMRDGEGRVLIDGFDDEVIAPTAAELAALERIPPVDPALRQDLALGDTEGDGERLERTLMRPALNFRGIAAGSVGSAARNTIVPEARAVVGIRMVPDQTVPHLEQVLRRHLARQGYHVVTGVPDAETRRSHEKVVQLQWHGGYPAARTAFDHAIAEDLAALLQAWSGDRLVQLPTMGGSLPLYLIQDVLGAPVLILPIANHDNNQHGENENLRLANLWDAMEIYAVAFALLGTQG